MANKKGLSQLMILCKEWTPDTLIRRPRLMDLTKSNQDYTALVTALYALVKDISDNFRVSEKMNPGEIKEAVDIIIERFPFLSIEDFLVFRRKAISAEYLENGTVYNDFGVPKLISWIARYDIEEVVPARERLKHDLKIKLERGSQEKYDGIKKLVTPDMDREYNLKIIAKIAELKGAIEEEKKAFWYHRYNKEIKQAEELFTPKELKENIPKINERYGVELANLKKVEVELNKMLAAKEKALENLKNKVTKPN